MSEARAPKDRREAWEAVAERVGGTFSEAKVTGGWQVVAPHEAWPLTMSLQVVNTGLAVVVYTSVRAHFLAGARVDADVDRMVGMFEVAQVGLDSLLRAGVAAGDI